MLEAEEYRFGDPSLKDTVLKYRKEIGNLLQVSAEFINLMIKNKSVLLINHASESSHVYDTNVYYGSRLDGFTKNHSSENMTVTLSIFKNRLKHTKVQVSTMYDITQFGKGDDHQTKCSHELMMNTEKEVFPYDYELDKNTDIGSVEFLTKFYNPVLYFSEDDGYSINVFREGINKYPPAKVLQFIDDAMDMENSETFNAALLNETDLKAVLISCILSSNDKNFKISLKTDSLNSICIFHRYLRYLCHHLRKQPSNPMSS